jgi:hypothetical protein
MIFNFVVRRLHFLARIPLAPQFFDAMLLIWTALFHRRRLHAIEQLEQHALRLPNVDVCAHRYGGIGFCNAGREFAHLHSNGLLDVKITRARALELIQSGRANPHHVLGESKWISFWIDCESDVSPALALLETGIRCSDLEASQNAAGVFATSAAPPARR